MIKKILKDKRLLSLYIVVIFCLVIGVTYALGTHSMPISFNTALIRIDESAYGDTTFDTTNIDFRPILDTDVETSLGNVIKIDFTVGGAEANNNSNIIYDIALADLEIHCDLISKYIKWKLIKDGTEIASSFDKYSTETNKPDYGLTKGIKNNRLVLTENQIDLPSYSDTKDGYHNYTFYMWMSDSCQKSDITECVTNADKLDQSSLIGKYFSGKIEVELYTETKVGYGPIANRENSETNKCLHSNPNRLNNAPNLDNGNLIPVYYDDTGTYTYTDDENNEVTVTGVWKKADSKNYNNSWYDYENKMWANAVIIGDSSKKRHYQKSSINTIIEDQDITAFYVWIPRFKYRVWNLNRQGITEDINATDKNTIYAYPAFTKGIDIEFEKGRNSSGNVKCTYDTSVTESITTLSDTCVYKDRDTITTASLNTDYTDAWYTHPAFTFGNKEIDGFWIGKFETSTETSSTCYATASADNCNNTDQTPRILPDVSSLRNQNVSNQFTTARKFQSYLSDINANMLTNLEWGAVTYLTHSIYGLCNGTTCQGVYHNNSSGYYTGSSMGDIVTDDTLSTSTYGIYNYKGDKLDSSGAVDTTVARDVTKVSSTTGNVTGVYDMSGGANEYVMGNMVNISNQFYPSYATSGSGSNPWSGSSTLDSKFYNSYSNGTNESGRIASNRGRLGDATAEVLGGTSSKSAWKPGSGITSSNAYFVSDANSWFYRGGYYSNSTSGAFYFYRNTGNSSINGSFRSSLS